MKRYIIPVLILINSPVIADTNMTNNPISNSSGSVTNLGVMNMPSKQFTNTYSLNQIQCQGDTFVIQPFLTSSFSGANPIIDRYPEPIYSTKDVKGAFDENGNEIGDGEIDDPTLIRGYRTARRFEKKNYAISPGVSLSWNINLDRKSIKKCREGQKHIVNLLGAKYEDARLSYELGRAKHCADLLKNGVRFKKGSKYEILCLDIELTNRPGTLIDHKHSISGNSSSDPFAFEIKTKPLVSSP